MVVTHVLLFGRSGLKTKTKLGMVTSNSSTWEEEAGELGIKGYPGLYKRDLEATLRYLRPFLQKQNSASLFMAVIPALWRWRQESGVQGHPCIISYTGRTAWITVEPFSEKKQNKYILENQKQDSQA